MRSFLSGLLALVAATALAEPTQPQPKLPTIPLVIDGKKLTAEVADDDTERETGMMFRKSMADGEGMVFVFDAPHEVSFWMKNTLIPLSVAYVNRSGLVLEIHDMKAKDETPVPSKFDTVNYAIEVPEGWFLRNAILPGSVVKGLPAPKTQ